MDIMLRSMPAQLFEEWMLFDTLEPIGPEREDYRFGALMSLLANINRNTKKQRKPFTVEDCVPRFGDSAPKAPPKKDWRAMRALAIMMTEESRKPTRRKRVS